MNEPVFLQSLKKRGDHLGLSRIHHLLALLGNPQERLQVVAVAGTNGKGSVCCFLDEILQKAGLVVGRFTSPQVFSFEERFSVNGVPLTEEEWDICVRPIEAACRKIEEETGVEDGEALLLLPTLFEVEVVFAILYFIYKECDIVIMEAGMGGELDATNVFSHPLLCVFTSIGLDHTAFLGATTEEIARHKAGLLKQGERAVSIWQKEEVAEVLWEEADRLGVSLSFADRSLLEEVSYQPLTFSYGDVGPVVCGMEGEYQIENAVVSLLAAKALRDAGYRILEEHILQGILRAYWPGRMERLVLEKCPQAPGASMEVYLDGAHNVPAARVLKVTIRRRFAGQRLAIIIGMFADKDVEGVMALLAPEAAVLICVSPSSPRGLPAKELAKKAARFATGDIRVAQSASQAVSLGTGSGAEHCLVCGSLIILAEM
ncbi:MAG: bifunctional folylpolyglutamate synthase/dihydrofolate synthase, partial [Lachnospiraceae bacterium]|nr:bifunctional folylpolyglutamate synthase/dihydrofolate synthase [Lachnospiraceae bacterium]